MNYHWVLTHHVLTPNLQISDLFFVHHRGSMNGLYMTMVMIGVCLLPC